MLENCKRVLVKLLRDEYDKFEVLSLARKFEVDVENQSSFSQKKYLLQKAVLDNITKEDSSNYYVSLLKETEQLCNFEKQFGYSCCLVGCLFHADKHRAYVRHLRLVHTNYPRLSCQFRHKCPREFSGVDNLVEHIKESHASRDGNDDDSSNKQLPGVHQATKCDMMSCGGRKFDNLSLLMRHINNHHLKEPRQCIFLDCFHHFNANSSSKNHFRLKHLQAGQLTLKVKHLVDTNVEIMGDLENVDDNVTHEENYLENYGTEDLLEIQAGDGKATESDGDYFLYAYADFMNRMCHVNFIPHKTMQIIATEYLTQSSKSIEQRKVKLRESLERLAGITEDQIADIVNEVLADDGMLNAQKQLDTSYKRNRFIMDNFKYVAPREIILNQEEVDRGLPKEVVHYIPILETFKHLVEDRSFIEVLEKSRNEAKDNNDVIKDIKDGSVYQSVEFSN